MNNILNDRNKVEDNFKRLLQQKEIFKSLGYDADYERNFILEEAKPFSNRILEAGTGKGVFTLALAMKGYYITTFDNNEEQMDCARMTLKYFNLSDNVVFKLEDAECLNFNSNSFDTIFTVNVLHHLKNPKTVFDELIRVLSKGGKLILADFTDKGFDVMDKFHALENNTHDRGKLFVKDAVQYFTEKGMTIKESKTVYQHVLTAVKV